MCQSIYVLTQRVNERGYRSPPLEKKEQQGIGVGEEAFIFFHKRPGTPRRRKKILCQAKEMNKALALRILRQQN